MSSDGHSDGGLVESGTWLPISLGLWGYSRDSSLYWGDSITLLDVIVYDGVTGLPLAPDSYTAVSANDSFPSNGEIPEPQSLLLLAILMAFCMLIRTAR